MQMKYGVLVLTVLLVACSGATGNVIDDGKALLEEQVEKLEAALEEDSLVAQKDALVEDAKTLLSGLQDELAAKEALVDQQKIILKDMDNERRDALAEAERCKDLEEYNQKLQDMLDICQEDLT